MGAAGICYNHPARHYYYGMVRASLQKIIVTVTIIATGVLVWTLADAFFVAPGGEIDAPWLAKNAPAAHAPSTALPARLIIPAIDIDADVQHVGIKADGSMSTPSNFTDVGWYKYGTIPGQTGSAVIDGHVDNGLSLAGVFKHLVELKVGDDVYVDQKDGSKLHFIVVDIKSFPYDKAPSELIFGRSDAARLNLITCKGDWIKDEKTYAERLVVFTKLAS